MWIPTYIYYTKILSKCLRMYEWRILLTAKTFFNFRSPSIKNWKQSISLTQMKKKVFMVGNLSLTKPRYILPVKKSFWSNRRCRWCWIVLLFVTIMAGIVDKSYHLISRFLILLRNIYKHDTSLEISGTYGNIILF